MENAAAVEAYWTQVLAGLAAWPQGGSTEAQAVRAALAEYAQALRAVHLALEARRVELELQLAQTQHWLEQALRCMQWNNQRVRE